MLSAWLASSVVATDTIDFNEQIRPILSRHCTACHGPDEESRSAGFRIDTFDGATEWAVVPGDADGSEVMDRVRSDEEGYRMPPAEHGHALTEKEIQLLEQWINEGADYAKHWSFVAPVQSELPTSKHDAWANGNPIDQFVAAKLDSMELAPSEQAEPHRLIRRVALDLTGLPPSESQVQRYVDAPTSETYESIVDELLESQAYGERWAAMWLDLARYADTIGYSGDENRTIWPWRDWGIRAFNSNMPYDQFTIEQIAGDMLDDPTDQQLLATAFHRNTLNNSEGGTNDEEFRTVAVKDRISTTINVWMGLTMRCAECHTHKYDPISQEEYYQFLDFFNQTEDSDKTDDRPCLEMFPEGGVIEKSDLDAQLAAAREKAAAASDVWTVLKPTDAKSKAGSRFEMLDDDSVVAFGKNPFHDDYTITFILPAGTHHGLRLEAIPDKRHNGNTGRSGPGWFMISEVQVTTGFGDELIEHSLRDAEDDHHSPNNEFKHAIDGKIDGRGWVVKHPQQGYRVRREAIMTFAKPIKAKKPIGLTVKVINNAPWNEANVGRVRISATQVEDPADKYRNKQLAPHQRELKRLLTQLASPYRVPIMKERPADQRRESYVNIRGAFMNHGEQVKAAVPESFHEFPAEANKDRLGVAKWLVSPNNPLTARVTVNRFWARMFGMGIVETEEDFGTQGVLPTNQELLDWLAVDFQEHGWNVKRLLKQIAMSATYRQTGIVSKEAIEKDPRNRYLSRGPRFRLSAEVVRDQALAVSGLLSDKLYGPPVYPPSPIKRITNAFTGGMTWTVSEGEDRYRRAIYTFLKRSQPHPLFETFDMATRDVCNMRRLRTNTPLQSFMTLNDETFIECARALATKMQKAGGDYRQQVREGLETALLRPAEEQELETLTRLFRDTRADYLSDVDNARRFAATTGSSELDDQRTADLAAMTVVANVILNLDSFLTH